MVRTFLPAPPDFDPEAFVRSAAPAVGIAVEAIDIAEVAADLSRTAGFAALLQTVDGIDEAEPAPVFRPRRDNT